MAALIGASARAVALIGRSGDAPSAAITTAVVPVVASLSPHDAWPQLILRPAGRDVAGASSGPGAMPGSARAWLAGKVQFATINMS